MHEFVDCGGIFTAVDRVHRVSFRRRTARARSLGIDDDWDADLLPVPLTTAPIVRSGKLEPLTPVTEENYS
ncbi:hypothetical protein L612_004900000070 [Rhodococcus rhodochrous J38]|nr:hypothetical protein L612_004900000070 [Rhodococcus rhodochrous J38]